MLLEIELDKKAEKAFSRECKRRGNEAWIQEYVNDKIIREFDNSSLRIFKKLLADEKQNLESSKDRVKEYTEWVEREEALEEPKETPQDAWNNA